MLRLRSARAAVLVVLALVGCAATKTQPAPKKMGLLCVRGAPDDAQVYVNETLVAHAAALAARPLPLPVGSYRVEVRADGFFTLYRDVELGPDKTQCVEAAMRRVPEGESGG